MILDWLLTLPQYLVPQRILSRIAGWIMDTKTDFFKRHFINWFIKKYQVDMREAANSDPNVYPSFNAFFTRQLKNDARTIVAEKDSIACPVDGSVSHVGTINTTQLFQAKGREYTLSALLAGDSHRIQQFYAGHFATLYLAPKDYHRVHMPITGQLEEMVYVPGRLFSVNPRTARVVNNLFARNERVICYFKTALGPMAVILVGAMIVGSIETVWSGTITPPHGSSIQRWNYQDKNILLTKGQELGCFKLGSTVIVLFPQQTITWADELTVDATIKMGQLLATEHRSSQGD